MPTTDQLDALRAMLKADFDRHAQLTERLDQRGGWPDYGILIGAAFFLGVRKRFADGHTPADVIDFVAQVRERFDPDGNSYDPHAGELVVRSALGERGLTADLPDKTVLALQTVIVGSLAADQQLGDVDDFLREVEALATKWGA